MLFILLWYRNIVNFEQVNWYLVKKLDLWDYRRLRIYDKLKLYYVYLLALLL